MGISIDFVADELKRVHMMDYFGTYIEDEICTEFWAADRHGNSINEFYVMEDSRQVSTQTTAKISSMINGFWLYEANKILEKNDSSLRVLTSKLPEKDGNESYDLVFANKETGELLKVESKISQGNYIWRGSKSSTNKVNVFLLISIKLNRDMKLRRGFTRGILEGGVFAALVYLTEKDWEKSNSEKSHGTTFRFEDCGRWDLSKVSLLKGNLEPKKNIEKNCRRWFNVVKASLDRSIIEIFEED